jgi:hypothetical protein
VAVAVRLVRAFSKLDSLQGAVIITVVAVYVMQMAIHEKIRVVSVWNGFMSAARAVAVTLVMASTGVLRTTLLWIRRADLDDMLVNVIAMNSRMTSWVCMSTVAMPVPSHA